MRMKHVDNTRDRSERCGFMVKGDTEWNDAPEMMIAVKDDGTVIIAMADDNGREIGVGFRGVATLAALLDAVTQAAKAAKVAADWGRVDTSVMN